MNRMKLFFTMSAIIALSVYGGEGYTQSTPSNASAEKLSLLLSYIENMYVDSVNSEELVEKAIIHLLEELDPHSTYFTE